MYSSVGFYKKRIKNRIMHVVVTFELEADVKSRVNMTSLTMSLRFIDKQGECIKAIKLAHLLKL